MQKLKRLSIYLIFILGVLILLYPLFSAFYYDYEASTEIDKFDEERKTYEEKQIDKAIKEAKAYNATLSVNEHLYDFYTEKDIEKGKARYASMLEANEMIGKVKIPRINQTLPVYAGTTEKVLQKGIGHLEKTSLPVGGESTHAVLTGHRGLPDKKLFTDLPSVKVGDMIYFTNIKETLAYKIVSIKEVTPDKTEVLNIQEGKDLMTLITCTPYMINSHRLIVMAERVPYTEELQQDFEDEPNAFFKFLNVYKYYLIGIGVFVLLLLVYKKHKNYREKIKKSNIIKK